MGLFGKKKSGAAQMESFTRSAKKVEELYTLGKELGEGGFAKVRKGTDKADGSEWAIKMIKTQVFNKNKEQTEKEVAVLKKISHKGVVQVREVVRTDKFYCIVLEMLRGGELFDRIVAREKYSEHDAKKVAYDLIDTVRYLHANHIVHRDLKPENILFDAPGDDANLKLTDFGFAEEFSTEKGLTQSCGTPEYVAPEIIENQGSYTEAVDVWSLGVIVYILLCGFPPFYGDNDDELFDRILAADFSFISPYWDPISAEAKDLIIKMLTVNPKKRITAEKALKHPWLADANKEAKDDEPDLSETLKNIRKFNATRKLRKGVLLVVAANRITSAIALAPE